MQTVSPLSGAQESSVFRAPLSSEKQKELNDLTTQKEDLMMWINVDGTPEDQELLKQLDQKIDALKNQSR